MSDARVAQKEPTKIFTQTELNAEAIRLFRRSNAFIMSLYHQALEKQIEASMPAPRKRLRRKTNMP